MVIIVLAILAVIFFILALVPNSRIPLWVSVGLLVAIEFIRAVAPGIVTR